MNELAAILVRDVTKVAQEIAAFPDEDMLWRVSPGISNSAGNLAVHLEGNLREYIGRQMGGVEYTRDRDLEFSVRNLARGEIVERLQQVAKLLADVVPNLSADTLEQTSSHLGVPITQRQFLLHLTGHLNYHLGQIDYLRRFSTGQGAVEFAKLKP